MMDDWVKHKSGRWKFLLFSLFVLHCPGAFASWLMAMNYHPLSLLLLPIFSGLLCVPISVYLWRYNSNIWVKREAWKFIIYGWVLTAIMPIVYFIILFLPG